VGDWRPGLVFETKKDKTGVKSREVMTFARKIADEATKNTET
jgi:hypothetical protein